MHCQGRCENVPACITVAEKIAYPIQSQLKVVVLRWGRCVRQTIWPRWKRAGICRSSRAVIIRFNDEAGDRGVVEHPMTLRERRRVVDESNDFDRFQVSVADYRA